MVFKKINLNLQLLGQNNLGIRTLKVETWYHCKRQRNELLGEALTNEEGQCQKEGISCYDTIMTYMIKVDLKLPSLMYNWSIEIPKFQTNRYRILLFSKE